MGRLTFSFATVLALITSGAGAQTSCNGHFVNRSNFTWTVAGYDGTKSIITIQPGATGIIPYGNPVLLTVSGNVPNRPYTKQFSLQSGSDGRFTILYSGNPGYIHINKPNPGDIVTCAGGC